MKIYDGIYVVFTAKVDKTRNYALSKAVPLDDDCITFSNGFAYFSDTDGNNYIIPIKDIERITTQDNDETLYEFCLSRIWFWYDGHRKK